jgi:hypothetical protein
MPRESYKQRLAEPKRTDISASDTSSTSSDGPEIALTLSDMIRKLEHELEERNQNA